MAAIANANEAAKKRIGVFMARVSTARLTGQCKIRIAEYARLLELRALFSEVMKTITAGIALCLVAFATSVSYGGQEPTGVAAVNVALKQNPKKKVVTDAKGNFVLSGLPPGSYTLFVWGPSAKDLHQTTGNVMIVATSYAIKVEEAKRSANQNHLTSDQLIVGVDIPIQVGPSGNVRGRVLAEGLKRFVWVPQRPGTNLPGYWAEEGSAEAVPSHNITQLTRKDLLTPNR